MSEKKLAVLLVVAMTLLLAINMAGCSNKKYIQFNGLYSNRQNYNDVHIYFRFYEDGTVTAALPVPVTNTYTFSMNELDKDNIKECTIRGKYKLKGNKVEFNLVDKNGSADFSGEFQENKVLLKSHSNINGKDSITTYAFYKW